MSDLYPTKTRLALLRDVADGRVKRRFGVDIDTWTDRTVTFRMEELERAGWVELGEFVGRSQQWQITPAGRAVLDAHGEAS